MDEVFLFCKVQMNIKELYSFFKEKHTISTDSRKIESGCIFFALKGDNFDGNLYAEQAINIGACFAVIDNPEYKKNSNFILVDDVLKTLQELARFHVSQLKPKLKVIGLTGSNGKTTTKELTASVLSSKYRVQYTEGNFNNHIGVPLTILKITTDTEIAVIEMGANHHKEIAFLASVAQPDFGLITNIGNAHLEGFGSIEGVLEAKSELFEYLKKGNGVLCINKNDKLLAKKYLHDPYYKKIYYGSGDNCIVDGHITESGLESQIIALSFGEKKYNFKTKLIGKYNLDNFLAAAAIGKLFNIPDIDIIESFENYEPNLNRSQFVETQKNRLIVDAYNANPTSMLAALDNFKNLKEKNKIVILGGMKELGKSSKSYHIQVIESLNTRKFDVVYLVGDEFSQIKHSYKIFKNVEELIKVLKGNNINNSTILIKGSRINRLEKVIEFL